jgi:hypothetical protein
MRFEKEELELLVVENHKYSSNPLVGALADYCLELLEFKMEAEMCLFEDCGAREEEEICEGCPRKEQAKEYIRIKRGE